MLLSHGGPTQTLSRHTKSAALSPVSDTAPGWKCVVPPSTSALLRFSCRVRAKLSPPDPGLSASTSTHLTTHSPWSALRVCEATLLLQPHHAPDCTQAPASLGGMPPWLLQSVDIYGTSTGDSASFWCGAAVPAASGVTMQKMVGEPWDRGKGKGKGGGRAWCGGPMLDAVLGCSHPRTLARQLCLGARVCIGPSWHVMQR